MIDVKGDVERCRGLLYVGEHVDERRVDRLGIDDRDPGVNAQDLDVCNGAQPLQYGPQATCRECQRIAAGEDDLPDLRVVGDVVEGRIEIIFAQRLAAVTDHVAAK